MVSREREREQPVPRHFFPKKKEGRKRRGRKRERKARRQAGRKEAGAREGGRRERGEGSTKPKVSLARVARTRAHHGGGRRKHCGLTWGQSR